MSSNDAALSAEDTRLFNAFSLHDPDAAEAAQQAIRDGANVNVVRYDFTPLMIASERGFDDIVSILLDAGADARWRNSSGSSAIFRACSYGRLPIVQRLINHDNGLLETVANHGSTPLLRALRRARSDIVRFLLDSGADPHHVDRDGVTALMTACRYGRSSDYVPLLVAAGVDVEARDERQRTALHHAARWGRSEIMLELIHQHNANMFAVDKDGLTPFDALCNSSRSGAFVNLLLEIYGNKLTQGHGRLALHELLRAAEYSFPEDHVFHPPLNPLQIVLPLGKLTLTHLRTLLHNFDPELIRNRDDTGKLPIHISCRANAPVEVLALVLELDPTTLHIADYAGALPIHQLCATITAVAEYSSVRYLVEQGGTGTLAARDRQGLMPLHVLCRSTNPSLRAVQYLMQSFPGSVAMQSRAGQYQFMMAAAADSSSASLCVIYGLVRANPGLVVPR